MGRFGENYVSHGRLAFLHVGHKRSNRRLFDWLWVGGPVVRVLATRTLDANDGQGAHTWTYTKPSNFVTNVADPLGNQTVHTFAVIANGTSSVSCKVHEVTTQVYHLDPP